MEAPITWFFEEIYVRVEAAYFVDVQVQRVAISPSTIAELSKVMPVSMAAPVLGLERFLSLGAAGGSAEEPGQSLQKRPTRLAEVDFPKMATFQPTGSVVCLVIYIAMVAGRDVLDGVGEMAKRVCQITKAAIFIRLLAAEKQGFRVRYCPIEQIELTVALRLPKLAVRAV